MPASLVLPWRLAGCPIGPFLPPWCLSNWSFPGSLVLPRLFKWSFPASLVPPTLSNYSFPTSLVLPWCLPGLSNWPFPASLVPPWRFAGCPIGPFLPPWCLGRFIGVIRSLWPPSNSRAVHVVFQWRLAVSRASKIKSGLGRLLESDGLKRRKFGW